MHDASNFCRFWFEQCNDETPGEWRNLKTHTKEKKRRMDALCATTRRVQIAAAVARMAG
jgi:hypothetical protein